MNMLYLKIIVNSQGMITFKFFQELWASLWSFNTPPRIDHRDWFIFHRLMLHRLVDKICSDWMLPDIAHSWSRVVYAIPRGCFLECTPVIFAPWCIHIQLPQFLLGRSLLRCRSYPFCVMQCAALIDNFHKCSSRILWWLLFAVSLINLFALISLCSSVELFTMDSLRFRCEAHVQKSSTVSLVSLRLY